MIAFNGPGDFSGALFLLSFHWLWMLTALGLGAWVGWRMAAEAAGELPAVPDETSAPRGEDGDR